MPSNLNTDWRDPQNPFPIFETVQVKYIATGAFHQLEWSDPSFNNYHTSRYISWHL